MSLYFEQTGDFIARRIPRIATLPGDDGNQATYSAPLAAPPWQAGDFVTRRIPRLAILTGDDGIEAQFNNAALTLSKWQFGAQEVQPPALRQYQRYAGILKSDASDQNVLPVLLVPFKQGWDIQSWQPPAPFSVRSSRLLAGATARGDDGIQLLFLPPWQMASGASTFPDYQNRAAGAIPSWNAGPPAGAINSIPNIAVPTVLKTSPGNLLTINIVVAGSAPGGVYDASGNFPSLFNQIGVLPNTVDGKPIVYDWPCQQGILIVPGAGQVVSAKWI